MSEEIKDAWRKIENLISKDYDYAWAIFANMAMPIMDYANVDHVTANKTAAYLMKHIFSYDVTGLKRYTDIVNAEPKCCDVDKPQPPNPDKCACDVGKRDVDVRELFQNPILAEIIHGRIVGKGQSATTTAPDTEFETFVKSITDTLKPFIVDGVTYTPELVGVCGNALSPLAEAVRTNRTYKSTPSVTEGVKILAVNPVNGKTYTEKDSVIFSANDKSLIVLLEKYHIICKKIGVNAEHLQSIELLKQRVKLYQEQLTSNTVRPEFVIDRKFKIIAVTDSGNIYDEHNSVLFCAKDRGFSQALSTYCDFYTGTYFQERADVAKELLRRVQAYQINVESKIPDTVGGEIDRCVKGIGVN